MNSSGPAWSIIQPTGSPGNGVNLRWLAHIVGRLQLQLRSGSSVRRKARWAKSSWCSHETTQPAPSSIDAAAQARERVEDGRRG